MYEEIDQILREAYLTIYFYEKFNNNQLVACANDNTEKKRN